MSSGVNEAGSMLLVDDEPHVCEGLRRVLYRDGYKIHTASSAEEAMAILEAHPIDVIVSDQRMPSKKGTELLSEVHTLYPRTVRMILSGAADIDEVARAMETGAIYKFLTKPIEPALLRANVREAFSRSASLTEAGRSDAVVTDEGTGLASRAELERMFPAVVRDAVRRGMQVCLLMLKVDQYDHVLSSFGNSFGRRFLAAIGDTLRNSFGCEHVLAHDAPGTFLLLTCTADSEARIAALDRQIDELFAVPLQVGERSITVTVSVGATAMNGPAHFDELLDRTYAAMKTGSERGGGTMQIFTPHLISAFRGQLELESDLRQAAASASFELHYQPQVALDTRRIVGLEALLRWRHPQRGFVSPQEFVPVAERIGLIGEIGAWVLETAVAQCAKWRTEGLAFGEIAVNVSSLQLKNVSFVERVQQVLQRYDWPARRLVLEVTESAAIEQKQSIVECVEALREIGVTLAVDDFGTGYANLSNLTRFSFSKLKIDRSLLTGVLEERGRRLYANVVGIARELGLDVVAEGVETEREIAFLRETGCLIVQGFAFARPVDAAGLVKLVARPGGRPRGAAGRDSGR